MIIPTIQACPIPTRHAMRHVIKVLSRIDPYVPYPPSLSACPSASQPSAYREPLTSTHPKHFFFFCIWECSLKPGTRKKNIVVRKRGAMQFPSLPPPLSAKHSSFLRPFPPGSWASYGRHNSFIWGPESRKSGPNREGIAAKQIVRGTMRCITQPNWN